MRPFVVAAIAAALVVPATASAHNTRWGWSTKLVERTLVSDGLDWQEGFEEIDAVHCRGQGNSFRRTPGGPKLFKHFYCVVLTTDLAGERDRYVIQVHILTRDDYTYEFITR